MPDNTAPHNQTFGIVTLDNLRNEVVGREREAELVVAALMAGRHLLLEGPPGTGKSTLLRAVAAASKHQLEFVEGNAELTPARLVGHFDPAQVMEAGYSKEIWIEGPLARALSHGSLLYIEEINRVPEETLNVLVTVMSEAELTVPRLGTYHAHPDFRVVAAMNPYDAVGTARISGAIYDRVCRVTMDYQSEGDEVDIAQRWSTQPKNFVESVVSVVRTTRSHPEVRVGSSVRGAIDLLLLGEQLASLRQTTALDYNVGLDSAKAALSGRIRVQESSNTPAETIIEELWAAEFAPAADPEADQDNNSSDGDQSGDSGKAECRKAAAPKS